MASGGSAFPLPGMYRALYIPPPGSCDLHGLGTLGCLGDFKFNHLSVAERWYSLSRVIFCDICSVHENICRAVFQGDISIALQHIKPFDCACSGGGSCRSHGGGGEKGCWRREYCLLAAPRVCECVPPRPPALYIPLGRA